MKKSIFTAPLRWGRGILLLMAVLAMVFVSGCGPKPIDPPPPPPPPPPMTPTEISQKVGPSVVNIYTNKGSGSGIIYRVEGKYGYIITNDHVIRKGSKFTIRMSDTRTSSATLIGTDPRADIAVLRIEADNLTAIKFADSSKVETGTKVVAIGNPLGSENSIDDGLISSAEVTEYDSHVYNINKYLQTSASIGPGNSGGPLLNMYGEVVGINDMGRSSATGAQNQNFAIPGNKAREIADELIKNGYVSYPYLGVDVLNKETKEGTAYIQISHVSSDSPAQKAGFKEDDIIRKVDDIDVSNVAQLREQLANKKGSKVRFTLIRGKNTGYLDATLENIPKGFPQLNRT